MADNTVFGGRFANILDTAMMTMRRLSAVFLILFLISPLRGESVSPSAPPPAHDSTIDRVHSFVSRMYVRPLAWFDRFFMPEREEVETNRSFLRVVSGYEWINKKGFQYRTHIRAKVRLPYLQDRLSLVVFGDGKDEFEQPITLVQKDETLTTVPVVPVAAGDRQGQVALRYLVFDWLNSRIDVDAGLQSKLRTQVAARFRQRIPITEKTLGRLTVTGFWLDRTGFGIRPRVDLERALSPVFGLRWGNQATHLEGGPGLDWESRVSLEARLSSKDAMALSFVTLGPTQPVTVVQLYRGSLLYHRQFFRDWIFFEIEPGVQWERSFTNSYPAVPTAGFRLEVRFQN